MVRNLTKFTRKHLCPSLFFNKVEGLWRLNIAIWCSCFNHLMFLIYQASDFNNWEKWEILLCFHDTHWKVFFQIKFHPGMKFYSFHPGMILTCKQKFFHPGTSLSQDEISSRLHVNALLVGEDPIFFQSQLIRLGHIL